jgi:hypothetical protein
MPLQLNTIEEYDFQHGFHRNYVTGKYIAIQPHDLGRPLTHAEMDYNLILNEQTQAGFRIFGSNEDLTLSDDDLGSSLVFHKISADDDDFARYQSKGYSVGQYIWILDCCAPKFNCALFEVDSITATDSGVCSFVVDSITATPEDPCISFVVDTICSFEVESIEFQNSGSDDVLPTPTPTATEVIEPTPTPTATEVIEPTPTATEVIEPTPTATEVPATPTPTPTVEAVTDRYIMSVTPPTAEESSSSNQYMQFNIQAINGYNPPAGTTVGYTITGDWEFTDIQVIGTNIGDGNNISKPFPLIDSPQNPYSNIFRIGEQGSTLKTAAIRVYVTNDANIEGLEQVTVTLASEDSLGNSTSSTEVSATGEIIDVTPTPTATEVPPTATPEPTATPMATPITEMSIPHKLIVATSVYNMIFEDVSAYMLVVNNDDPIWYGGPDYSQYDINSGIYTHPDAQMLGKVPVPSCVPDGDKAELLSTINITDRGYGLEYEVSNTRVYVWFKDDNGHVYGVRDGLCYPVQNQHVHMWGMNYGSLIDILNNGQTLETSYTISDSSMVS